MDHFEIAAISNRLFCSMGNSDIDIAWIPFQICKFWQLPPHGFQFNGILIQRIIPIWWRCRIVELRPTVMINILLYFLAELKVEEFLFLLWRKANAEMAALEPIYSSQFTLSTQLMRANYIDAAPQFFRNLPPLFTTIKIANR